MSTRKESFLEEVRTIQREMDLVLEGMDYCLDWKPSEGEWSAREVVYHLVDTPAGGIHTAVKGLLDGRMEEVPVTASLTNLAGERHATDLDAVRGDIARVTSGMEEALSSATDADLAGKRFLFHSITPLGEGGTHGGAVDSWHLRAPLAGAPGPAGGATGGAGARVVRGSLEHPLSGLLVGVPY